MTRRKCRLADSKHKDVDLRKYANMADLLTIPSMDSSIRRRIHYLAKTLSALYGEHRNVNMDDGGYVLYAEHGTAAEELKQMFDYTAHAVEWAARRVS